MLQPCQCGFLQYKCFNVLQRTVQIINAYIYTVCIHHKQWCKKRQCWYLPSLKIRFTLLKISLSNYGGNALRTFVHFLAHNLPPLFGWNASNWSLEKQKKRLVILKLYCLFFKFVPAECLHPQIRIECLDESACSVLYVPIFLHCRVFDLCGLEARGIAKLVLIFKRCAFFLSCRTIYQYQHSTTLRTVTMQSTVDFRIVPWRSDRNQSYDFWPHLGSDLQKGLKSKRVKAVQSWNY